MLPLISVIVPVYNVEKYLLQCLDSITNQTYDCLEIICVNDGSTDKSLEILEKYQQKDPRIKIITQSNQGLSAARNTGLKHATGDLISFVDSDDWIENNALSSMYEVFNDPDIDFACYGTFHRFEGAKHKDRLGHVYANDEIKWIDNSWITKVGISAWSKIYRTKFLKDNQLSFPVGLYYEDIAFFWGCVSFAKKVALSKAVLYNYRIRDDSIMGKSQTQKKGMAIHHLYEIDNVFQIWTQNGFLKSNKKLFQFVFEKYVQEGWKYLHNDNKTEYISKTSAYAHKWDIQPRRFTLAYDLIAGNTVFLPKYRWARSLRKIVGNY